MMEVGAFPNASISPASGFGTAVAAMVMVILIGPLARAAWPASLFAASRAEIAFLFVVRMARRGAECPSHSLQSAITELNIGEAPPQRGDAENGDPGISLITKKIKGVEGRTPRM